ncbi:MAG: lamin tail domain-containing protein [Verrucomicrobiota bacterium]
MKRALLISLLLLPGLLVARAEVVINELLYHAPNDLEELEFLELHNHGAQAVDLSGWKLTKGLKYTFSPGAEIPADGFVVLCKDASLFARFYKEVTPLGVY